jgi:hypothetical protein
VRLGRRHRGNPYPDWVKREAVDYVQARRASGVTVSKAASELGIASFTIVRWGTQNGLALGRGRFVPVSIQPEITQIRGNLIIRGPAGLCIEGLDLDGLAALIKKLS